MSSKTLFILSLVLGAVLLIILWPYIVILMGILTMAVCALLILAVLVMALFILLQFVLVPYYAVKNRDFVEVGRYSIEDAEEPGDKHGGDKEI